MMNQDFRVPHGRRLPRMVVISDGREVVSHACSRPQPPEVLETMRTQVTDDRLSGVRLQSGHVIDRSALVVGPRFEARHALLDDLDVTVTEHPLGIGCQVQADATGLTAASGVWVAGNAADVTAGVMQSASSGVTAAAAINADLTAEDTARPVAASRA